MLVGGPKAVTDVVSAVGGVVGPRSKWLGSWAIRSGLGDWDAFFTGCKADGVQPLVLWFAWGDFISPAAIAIGVQDTQQNVWKTQALLLPLLKTAMRKAKAAGVQPIVIVENEFNKNGCEKSPGFAKWFDDCAAIVRAECPGAEVCFAPGAWGDLAALASFYAPQISRSDMVGLQCGFFLPRNPGGNLAAVGPHIAALFQALGSSKPRILYDAFLSTYGGAYSTMHPFAGGDGRALEAQQALGIASLASIPNLTAIIYRDLKDNPAFDVKNYGGWAERFVGVERSDGSKKPGYDALLALAKIQPNVEDLMKELEATKAALQRALFDLKVSDALAVHLRAQIDAARADLNPTALYR